MVIEHSLYVVLIFEVFDQYNQVFISPTHARACQNLPFGQQLFRVSETSVRQIQHTGRYGSSRCPLTGSISAGRNEPGWPHRSSAWCQWQSVQRRKLT